MFDQSTKKLNVFGAEEKIETFLDLYQNGIDIDPNSMIQTLNRYKQYVQWCNNHFDVANYFYYEEHLPNIEKYILNLPIFQNNKKISWKNNYVISLNQWNMYHYLTSDLGTLALENNNQPSCLTHEVKQLEHSVQSDVNQQTILRNKFSVALVSLLPDTHKTFIAEHNRAYHDSLVKIKKMVQDGIMITPPPIKKQTLAEKKHLIKNYHSLLTVYNQWIELNPDIGYPLDHETLDRFAEQERQQWNPVNLSISLSDPPPNC